MAENVYLTVQEVADYLRLSLHSVRAVLRSGKLKGTKIGREYRISKRALDTYLDAVENVDAQEALNETYRGQG